MTEKELIKACMREDRQSQQLLFQRYAGKMLGVCMRYARNRQEAEDILQDGFIKVFDNMHRFRFEGSFEGWIRRIMINTALKSFKKKSFKNEQIGLENYQEDSCEPDIYSQLSEQELLKIIGELPDGYRVVFNLYVIEGYSHKEIGELLGIQESTSRSQLTKARKLLQQKILGIFKSAI